MAGTSVRILPKTTYNFDSQVASGSSTPTIMLAKALDVTGYREATLLVRVHSFTVNTGNTFTVQAGPADQTTDDPSAVFRPLGAAGVVQVQVVASLTAPTLLAAPLARNFGPYLFVQLFATNNNPTQLAATLSVDLSLKV